MPSIRLDISRLCRRALRRRWRKTDFFLNSAGAAHLGSRNLLRPATGGRRWTRELCPVDQAGSFKRDLCMLALARLGDIDDAFAIALRTYPNRVGRTPAEEDRLWLDTSRYGETDILMGPAAAPLRRDPRFLELARRLGLLAYWRSGRLPDFCTRAHEPVCRQISH